MYKMLLGILIMLSQQSIGAYDFNTKTLDSEAEVWVSKTWSKTSFNQNQIKESLIFLDPSDELSKTHQQYLEVSKFDEICKKNQDHRLDQFISLCKNIYEEDNITNKISVLILLESIVEKYDFIFRKAESLKPKKEKEDESRTSDSLLNMFFNADRNIKAH